MPTGKNSDPSAKEPSRRSSDLFIVDNSDEQWKAARYLHGWCDIARSMDVATGYFEIGALLTLEGQWQKLENIRILMGDEVSLRTSQAFEKALSGLAQKLDASLMINYDLHWNPVRLMQRIGRVDRRLDPQVEAELLADHPEMQELRGVVHFWNFLPPGELNDLLKLYERVAHKTLRISKIFGIEGSKLLRPDDDFEALKEFNQAYEGVTTPTEEMRLAYHDLLNAHPGLEENLANLPLRVFSGHSHPSQGARAVFFCYQLPGPDAEGNWSLETGSAQWYLLDLASGNILEDAESINRLIRCHPETPRQCLTPQTTLVDARKQIEAFTKDEYLKPRQAPVGVRPVLKAWLELN